jgi:hypothetical protein
MFCSPDQCLHPVEPDMRAFKRDSGFDPKRSCGELLALATIALEVLFVGQTQSDNNGGSLWVTDDRSLSILLATV